MRTWVVYGEDPNMRQIERMERVGEVIFEQQNRHELPLPGDFSRVDEGFTARIARSPDGWRVVVTDFAFPGREGVEVEYAANFLIHPDGIMWVPAIP